MARLQEEQAGLSNVIRINFSGSISYSARTKFDTKGFYLEGFMQKLWHSFVVWFRHRSSKPQVMDLITEQANYLLYHLWWQTWWKWSLSAVQWFFLNNLAYNFEKVFKNFNLMLKQCSVHLPLCKWSVQAVPVEFYIGNHKFDLRHVCRFRMLYKLIGNIMNLLV